MVVVEPDKLPSPKEVGSSSSHPPSPRRPAHARRLSLAQREVCHHNSFHAWCDTKVQQAKSGDNFLLVF